MISNFEEQVANFQLPQIIVNSIVTGCAFVQLTSWKELIETIIRVFDSSESIKGAVIETVVTTAFCSGLAFLILKMASVLSRKKEPVKNETLGTAPSTSLPSVASILDRRRSVSRNTPLARHANPRTRPLGMRM